MAKRKKGINLEGSLVIDKIKTLKDNFDTAAKSSKKLSIHSDEITEIDLTGVQFLHYMKQQAQMNKLDITFDFSIGKEQQEMLTRNGFSNITES